MQLPDFAARCGWPPKEKLVRARLEALNLLVRCRRCKGTGRYDQNPVDQRCYGCGGEGVKLPPLTARLAATVRDLQGSGALDAYMDRARETYLRRQQSRG